MKRENIQKASQLNARLIALDAASASLELGTVVTISLPKTGTGPGAQIHIEVGAYAEQRLREVLQSELEHTVADLAEIGVDEI